MALDSGFRRNDRVPEVVDSCTNEHLSLSGPSPPMVPPLRRGDGTLAEIREMRYRSEHEHTELQAEGET